VFREAGKQVSPVTISRPSPWLHPVCRYKRPLKEAEGLLLLGALLEAFGFFAWLLAFCFGGLFAFEYWEEAFSLGLLVWEVFGREKSYQKGKLLKRKEFLKGKF
jgi:hypothetical protein